MSATRFKGDPVLSGLDGFFLFKSALFLLILFAKKLFIFGVVPLVLGLVVSTYFYNDFGDLGVKFLN